MVIQIYSIERVPEGVKMRWPKDENLVFFKHIQGLADVLTIGVGWLGDW